MISLQLLLKRGGRPYDLVKKEKTDFPINEAQAVFRTYADITINYGMIRSNHPILEATNLVYNALAMEDEKERERLLSYFLTKSTAHQDALNEMVAIYKEKGDLWPETSQYLNAAASILTRLMLVVNRYDPGLRLGDKYANLLFSLPALAYQERTLALIRTSETTGYYVDIFRSKSKLPDQYHDYLYHNIGDRLEILNSDVCLKPTPDRYMANAGLPWVQNQEYRHPGWHFFEDVCSTGDYQKNVRARFIAEKFEKPIYMDLHLSAGESREYSQVLAPPTFEAPAPYEDKPTPTLVIRKKGEAWTQPFVVVFEPFDGNSDNHSIRSVEKLEQDGIFKGLRIRSKVAGNILVQYIIAQDKEDHFADKNLGIYFKGSFAVITENADEKLQNVYIGDGEELRYGDINVKPAYSKKSLYQEFR
ncbi:MAG: hypothetical protein R6V72_22895 [Cyclobacterium sp.]|uniref:hypothetical protein n=1 Tax=Cyclobacterium sp. TaxID=1966343 RepID=UPI0039709C6E